MDALMTIIYTTGDHVNTSILLITLLTVISILYFFTKSSDIVPGPMGYPLVGFWPILKADTCFLVLIKLQKKYGDIFSFNYAGTLYIHLGSIKIMKEFFVSNPDYLEKLKNFSIMQHHLEDGIALTNGESWKTLRKFMLLKFKELGMASANENASGPFYDAVNETIECLKDASGKPVEMRQLLKDRCSFILRQTLFRDYGITQQEVEEIINAYRKMIPHLSMTNLLFTGNFARYFILPFTAHYKEAVKNDEIMRKAVNKIVNDHKKRFDEAEPHNFIDAYIKERNLRQSKGDRTAEYFTDKALVSSLVEFVGDGVLTISAFLTNVIKSIVDHPEEQEKIYAELKEVVGEDRLITIADKNRLIYTNAFIQEVIRTSNFMLMVPGPAIAKDMTIRGYRIPKGAVTVINYYSCHYDPSVYKDPRKFNPERFISKDGKQKEEFPVLFGVGRRSCLGESFILTQVFLFLTTIIQHFKLTPPENYDVNKYRSVKDEKFEIYVKSRN